MRAGADAEVVRAVPVREVVARLVAGPREARDLVAREPRRLERSTVTSAIAASSSSATGARRPLARQAKNGVASSYVSEYAETWGRAERERRGEVRLPVGDGAARNAEDEVEAQVVEARLARRRDGRADVLDRVVASERPEMRGRERLRAEGEPRDAGGAVAARRSAVEPYPDSPRASPRRRRRARTRVRRPSSSVGDGRPPTERDGVPPPR